MWCLEAALWLSDMLLGRYFNPSWFLARRCVVVSKEERNFCMSLCIFPSCFLTTKKPPNLSVWDESLKRRCFVSVLPLVERMFGSADLKSSAIGLWFQSLMSKFKCKYNGNKVEKGKTGLNCHYVIDISLVDPCYINKFTYKAHFKFIFHKRKNLFLHKTYW